MEHQWKLGDLDLGGSDAESDRRLAEYFVTTPYVEEALHGRRTIFLGRKGSGKSALCTSLPIIADNDHIVHLISPEQYAWNAHAENESKSLLSEQAHTYTWIHTLSAQIATAAYQANKKWSPQLAETLHEVNQKKISGESAASGSQPEASPISRLRELGVSFAGFGFNFAREAPQHSPLLRVSTERLLALVDSVANEAKVTLVLDRLDDSWDASEESKSMLIGLIKASKTLNDNFSRRSEVTGIRVLIFLRTEIYDSLDFDDKDKLHTQEQSVDWTFDLLSEMMSRRLPPGLSLDSLFEAGRMGDAPSVFAYIVRRTFLRPREVIQFFDECVRLSDRSSYEITKATVRQAESQFSQWKLADLKQEFRRVHPSMVGLLEQLRGGPRKFASWSHLRDFVAGDVVIDNVTQDAAINSLFEISVLGVQAHTNSKVMYRAEHPDLIRPKDGVVHVHPSLRKALGLQ